MYDVLTARKYTDKSGEEKTTFTKIGVAFDNRNGDGMTVTLNALPLSDKDGEVRMIIKKSKPKDNSYAAKSTVQDDLGGDEIPFVWVLPMIATALVLGGVA